MLRYRGGVTIKKSAWKTPTVGLRERTLSSLLLRHQFSSFPYKSFPSYVEGQRHNENRQRNAENFQDEEIYGYRGFNLDDEADTLGNWRRGLYQQQRQRKSPNYREEKEDPSFSSFSSSSSSSSTSRESVPRLDSKVLENEEWERKIDRWMKDFVRMIHPDFFHSHPTERGTNERSFKLLNNFIDHQTSLSEGKPEQSPSSSTINLEFHIRKMPEKKKNKQEKGEGTKIEVEGEEEVDFRFFKHQLRFLREDRERLSPSKHKLHLKKSLLALFIAAELPGIPTDIDLTGFSVNAVSQITKYVRQIEKEARKRTIARLEAIRDVGMTRKYLFDNYGIKVSFEHILPSSSSMLPDTEFGIPTTISSDRQLELIKNLRILLSQKKFISSLWEYRSPSTTTTTPSTTHSFASTSTSLSSPTILSVCISDLSRLTPNLVDAEFNLDPIGRLHLPLSSPSSWYDLLNSITKNPQLLIERERLKSEIAFKERQIAVSIGVKYVLSEERFHSASPSYLQFLNSILDSLTREKRLKSPPITSLISTSLPLEPTSHSLDPFKVSRFVQAFGTRMEVRDRRSGKIDEAEPVYLGKGGELSELAILIRRKKEEQQREESASSSWPFVVDHDLGLIIQETATLEQIDNFLELHGSVVAQGATRAARMAERVDRYRLKTKNELGLMNLRKERGLFTGRLERACQGLMKPYVLNDLRENAKGLSFVISEGRGLKIDKGLELLSCGTIVIPWDFDGPCE